MQGSLGGILAQNSANPNNSRIFFEKLDDFDFRNSSFRQVLGNASPQKYHMIHDLFFKVGKLYLTNIKQVLH